MTRTCLIVAWLLLLAVPVSADTFNATIVLPAGNQATPGEALPIEVHGILTDNDPGNGGLAFFCVDFTMSGPQTVSLDEALVVGPPGDGSMDLFVQPLGFDTGYGGSAVGSALMQAGGAMNTIGNNPAAEPFVAYPAAEFIAFDVAHAEQVLLEGALTLPAGAASGTYTLSLENVLANVVVDGQAPASFGVYAVAPATTVGDAVDVVVAGGSAADLNGDGVVNAADLAILLGDWGVVDPCPPMAPADFNGDCAVNAADLALLLGDWSP